MQYIFMSVSAFLSDIFSKRAASDNILPNERIEIIKDKLHLTNVKNSGAAYGLFSKNRKLLTLATFFSVIRFVFIYRDCIKKYPGKAYKISCALVFGGAAGNIYERIINKEVTDFIQYKNNLVFNLADIYIVLGAVIFAVGTLMLGKELPKNSID